MVSSHCDKLNSFNIYVCPGDFVWKTVTVCITNYSTLPQVSGEGTILDSSQLRKCNLAEGKSLAQDEQLASGRGRAKKPQI